MALLHALPGFLEYPESPDRQMGRDDGDADWSDTRNANTHDAGSKQDEADRGTQGRSGTAAIIATTASDAGMPGSTAWTMIPAVPPMKRMGNTGPRETLPPNSR